MAYHRKPKKITANIFVDSFGDKMGNIVNTECLFRIKFLGPPTQQNPRSKILSFQGSITRIKMTWLKSQSLERSGNWPGRKNNYLRWWLKPNTPSQHKWRKLWNNTWWKNTSPKGLSYMSVFEISWSQGISSKKLLAPVNPLNQWHWCQSPWSRSTRSPRIHASKGDLLAVQDPVKLFLDSGTQWK